MLHSGDGCVKLQNAMTAKTSFDRATAAVSFGEWIFRAFFLLSAIALLAPQPAVQGVVNPLLIVATVAGLAVSVLTQIWQNEGNRLLRATQLADALGVPVGITAKEGYYNNLLPPSVARLAATTFENTHFSSAVLQRMVCKERIVAGAYLLLFLFLIACRWTSAGLLVLLAQALFSADVLMHWVRMERFQNRVSNIREHLHQFFVQGGMAGDRNALAVALAAFTDYECAKAEAAMPLDGKLFKKLNPTFSKEWDQLRTALKIP